MTHSFVFGHLPIITKLMKHMPRDVHPDYIAQLILENWETLFPECTTCPGIFYVDLWPMGPPTIFSESLAKEFNATVFLMHLHSYGSENLQSEYIKHDTPARSQRSPVPGASDTKPRPCFQ